jgi:hypothetical protein
MTNSSRLFVCYAEKDSRLVSDLLDRLRPHFAASKSHAYAAWEFHRLLAGELWHERIQAEIAGAHVGLLCLSPEFLASPYIRSSEVPALLRHHKVVPVSLKPVDSKLHETFSLADYQWFRLRTASGRVRCYSELRGAADRDAFALELFRQIEGRLASGRACVPVGP